MLAKADPERAAMLLAEATEDSANRYKLYKQMAEMKYGE